MRHPMASRRGKRPAPRGAPATDTAMPYHGGKRPAPRGAPVAVVAGLLALAVSACSVPVPRAFPSATPGGPPSLTAPTGPHAVGATRLYLKDTSRPDPWVPGRKARELMVSLWYPAERRDGRRARYMTAEESALHLKGSGLTGVPPDVLSRTRTNAVRDAEPAGGGRGLPLVLLSPGFTSPRATLTSLAEELASQGYLVAAIDHTHESHATAFPDGRIATCAACDVESEWGFGAKVVEGRAADVSFVLDELLGSRPAWSGSRLIDPSRIAMAGHSIGGASALAAMVKDRRVRAGIDMDGTTYARIPQGGLSRPFLFLGGPGHGPGGRDTSWDRDWRLLTGWKRRLVVSGAAHQSFTDIPLLADSLGAEPGGGLSAARSVEITRSYVLAFLDLHLRRRPRPLLDGPSPRFPEVAFCVPGGEEPGCRGPA